MIFSWKILNKPKFVDALGTKVLPLEHDITKMGLASKPPILVHVTTTFARYMIHPA
jgi:hypothetical protein